MLTQSRMRVLEAGLDQLPVLPERHLTGRNGEELATDEAAVWKRVLAYRVARLVRPAVILETHRGLGVGSAVYRAASRRSRLITCDDLDSFTGQIDFIDIDPFGQPWDALEVCTRFLHAGVILMVSNGEAHAVIRNLRNAQRFPTEYYGRRMPLWVMREYLPRLETLTELSVRFFYAFPTTVRVVLAGRMLPSSLWSGCPQWMWWLSKYANEGRVIERYE